MSRADGRSVPMYQPWATNMRMPNAIKSAPVPPHRYGVYGVDLSRYVWNICRTSATALPVLHTHLGCAEGDGLRTRQAVRV
jgi:hypothetical protein